MEVEKTVRKGQRPSLPKKAETSISSQRFGSDETVLGPAARLSRPLTPRILSIARSDDFLRQLDIVQLPADTNVLAACVYSPEAVKATSSEHSYGPRTRATKTSTRNSSSALVVVAASPMPSPTSRAACAKPNTTRKKARQA